MSIDDRTPAPHRTATARTASRASTVSPAASPERSEGSRGTGQWRHDLTSERWWWSVETFRIHGFEPHEVVPTTNLVLAHKHPQDRERVRRLLESATVSGRPFHSTHRIMDARGEERVVVMVGQGRRDPQSGEVVELMGYVVDATAPVAERAAGLADGHLRAAFAHRGAIDQAKGIVSATHGVTIDEAFALLRSTSNTHNVPVRTLAAHLVRLGDDRPADERRTLVDEYLHDPRRATGEVSAVHG